MNERLNHLDHLSDSTPPGPPVDFERTKGRTLKVACTVCGRRGYPGGGWQDSCRRGHRACRNGCGRLMSVLQNGAARRHPSHKCPVTNPDVKWPIKYREASS